MNKVVCDWSCPDTHMLNWQIEEIFKLFSNGDGTIDNHELELAMIAVGFRSESTDIKMKNKNGEAILDAIAADGTVMLLSNSKACHCLQSSDSKIQIQSMIFLYFSWIWWMPYLRWH